MKVGLKWVCVLLLPTMSACSDSGVEISEQQLGTKWPFSVSAGRLECKSEAVLFHAEGKSYAVNGRAKDKGYAAIEPIWKEDPEFFQMARELAKSENKPINEIIKAMGAPTRMSISPVLDRGLALCR